MKTKKIQKFLGWCTVINFALLGFTTLMLMIAHDWAYSIHGAMFNLTIETYDALLFSYLAFWKALIIVFVFIPYIAIRIVRKPI